VTTYQMAILRKPLPDGRRGYCEDRAWIPSEFCSVGRAVRVFRAQTGGWDAGWTVSIFSPEKISAERAASMHARLNTWREMTVAGRPSFKGKSRKRGAS